MNTIFKHPSKTILFITTIVAITGIALLVLATTDLFRTPFFHTKNLTVGFLIAISLGVLIKLYINYFNSKKQR